MLKQRIASIDILRGLVMVIMALDHIRDYFHLGVFGGLNDPSNLETTTPILFFTRFITHFCAPIFIFLAGTSGYLYSLKQSKHQLSKFFLTRGLWLIFVEIVIMNFLWWFDISYGFINLQVIWAIGVCMVMMSVFIYLPFSLNLALGLVLIFAHNSLDGITIEGSQWSTTLWYVLHQPHFFQLSDSHYLSISYPIIPWIGVMLLGFCFGRFYHPDYRFESRKKWLLGLGISTTLLFFLLRFVNVYGDPEPWASQSTLTYTFLSFLKLHKYPPSLLYLLITLGPSFLFLYAIEGVKNSVTNFFQVFGKVPFFYYVMHILIIHLFAVFLLLIMGNDWTIMIISMEKFSPEFTGFREYGYSLWMVYVVWIIIIAILYPICKRYMVYKRNHREYWWLGYL